MQSPDTSRLYDALQQQVHVWYCHTGSRQGDISGYLAMLSEQEQARYHQFSRNEDRQCYLRAHILLRKVLSNYVSLDPAAWLFTRDNHGKPVLDPAQAKWGLEFNLTHTGGMSACIVSRSGRCGIDVENTQRSNQLDKIARRMFAPQEYHDLQNKADFQQRFYYYWTLREAAVKALGSGLSDSKQLFYFELDEAEQSARMIPVSRNSAIDTSMCCCWLSPHRGYTLAAVFSAQSQTELKLYEMKL